MSTGLEPRVPATARVELADQIEQTRGRGVEMRREFSDLIA